MLGLKKNPSLTPFETLEFVYAILYNHFEAVKEEEEGGGVEKKKAGKGDPTWDYPDDQMSKESRFKVLPDPRKV